MTKMTKILQNINMLSNALRLSSKYIIEIEKLVLPES